MFSVVIPLYNKSLSIERTLKSVLAQTIRDFELIIVNDGSTDNSLDVVLKFKDNRIKIIHQENKGEGSARNSGIKVASRTFICFLDADDIWEPFFLEEISFLIKNNTHASLFCTAYLVKDYTGVVHYKPKMKFNNFFDYNFFDYFYSLSKNSHPIFSSSVCVDRMLFSYIGFFDESLKIGADIDMWIRICSVAPPVYSYRFCVTYCKDAENRSTNQDNLYGKMVYFLLKIAYYAGNLQGCSEVKKRLLQFVSIKIYEMTFGSTQNFFSLHSIYFLDKFKENLPINLRIKFFLRKKIGKLHR